MKLSMSVLAFAAGLLSLSGATPARAVTLGDPAVTGTVLFNLGGRQDLAALGSIGMTDARFGTVSATVSGTPSSSIVASAHIGPDNQIPSLFGRGVGTLTYYFEIDGPAGSVPVLIHVAGAATGSASAGASFVVASRWTLYDSVSLSSALAGDEINSTQITGTFDQSFDRTVSIALMTNHLYPVLMLADAEAAATAAGSNSVADAFVDPIFSFGSGVDPLAYSFRFSNGIGNTAVPEPGPLSLVSAGILSLGLVRARTRRRPWSK
jgi:hypothetical protein